MRAKYFSLFVIFLLISSIAFSQPNKPDINNLSIEEIDEFITEIMKEWKVPGLSIAVVKDDSAIIVKGYGLRDIKNKLPVTPQTLFGIASCSKAFTCTDIGILVDQEKLTFGKSVKNVIPEFSLSDSYATEHITIRDLVTHQSGLARHDRLWYMSPFSRNELLHRMRFLEMNRDLHQSYQYNNLMFVVAGVAIERASGMMWEEFTKKNILEPLSMNNTYLSINDLKKSDNHALPYGEFKEQVDIIPYCDLDAAGPCGSINSSAEDMANWLTMNMNNGKFKDKQIISEKSLKEIHSPQMISSKSIDDEELYYSMYGMGWGINLYRDNLMLSHTGSIDGYASLVTFLPNEKFGIVILTNLEGNGIHRTIAYQLFDKYLGLEPVKWNERARESAEKSKEFELLSKKREDSIQVKNTKPSKELASYIGEYENPAYGKVTVKLESGKLRVYYNNYFYRLEHYHYDVFTAIIEEWDDYKKIKFDINKNGNIEALLIPFESSIKDIVFKKK